MKRTAGDSRSSPGNEPTGAAAPVQPVGFGGFEIDPVVWELRCRGRRVALGPRPVRLLHLLVSRHGQLVTRDEIYRSLWPGGEIDVNRATNTCIRQIRRAIGDRVGNQSLIRAYTGRGYRFIAPSPAKAVPVVRRVLSRFRPRRVLLGGLAAGIAAALFIGRPLETAHPPTIAVLPFSSLGPDSIEYLGAGIATDLVTGLTRVDPSHLRVLASASARPAALRGDADYVVSGTLRADSGGQVLTAQLVRTRDGLTLWADRFERMRDGSLLLQREVAERIVNAVAPRVIPELRGAVRRGPVPAAREAFLRATYLVRQGHDLAAALTSLDTVIARDRGFAPGYALRADALFLLRDHEAARTAANRALRLDSTEAHAHFILGNLYLITDWKWAAAEAELRRAIDLAPGTALYHLGYGYFLAAAGRAGAAVREADLAVALDPLSPAMLTEAGTVFLISGDYPRAVRRCDEALELDPGAGYAAQCATEAHALAGSVSLPVVDRLARANGADPGVLFAHASGSSMARLGLLRAWRLARLEARVRLSPDSLGGHGWYDLAVAYAEAGRVEDAVAALQRSAGERAIAFVASPVDPRLHRLRADQRFQALERRLAGSECGRAPARDWRCPRTGA